jgi:glycerol-3-phosphate dehydrogenase
MPIAEGVRDVLFEGLDPLEGITRLMSREPKEERPG